MSLTCPLQKAEGFKTYQNVFLKRMDLLPFGGGNKIPRFDYYFSQKGHLKKVVVMSNPGSHTFHVLKNFLTMDRKKNGAESFCFLERKMPLNPYHMEIKEEYENHTGIQSSTAAFIVQMLRYICFKYLYSDQVGAIGIGGHVKLKANPYECLFLECVREHAIQKYKGKVIHLVPVASGNMVDCFLKTIQKEGLVNHSIVGVMTGDPLSRPFLRLKYGLNERIKLLNPSQINYEDYLSKAYVFHQKTSVYLDPTHTIHLWDAIDHKRIDGDPSIVLWMTCPFIKRLIPEER